MNKQTAAVLPGILYQFTPFLILLFTTTISAQTLYVNHAATGIENGRNWNQAYTDLQDALEEARTGTITQIWVAKGTYKPTVTNDRSISFDLPNGVAIYGGFEGDENSLTDRDIESHETVLSGNIGDQSLATDNVYHVVKTMNNIDEASLLDGFTIRDGYADATGLDELGGGLLNVANVQGEKVLSKVCNCTFEDNYAKKGGGLANTASNMGMDSSMIISCVFTENDAAYGGGVYNLKGVGGQTKHTFINCVFENNDASIAGGGLANDGDTGGIIDIINEYNSGYFGCVFLGNYGRQGGAYYAIDVRANSTILFRNCTMYDNLAERASFGDAISWSGDCKINMGNMIIWEGSSIREPAFTSGDSKLDFENSLIENGGLKTEGKFSSITDPGFVNPLMGNLQINPCSELIDEGINYGLPMSIDAKGNPRMNNGVFDVGAYEFAGDAIGLEVLNAADQVLLATEEVTGPDGWTHYYDCNTERILLSIFKDGQNIGSVDNNTLTVRTTTASQYTQLGQNLSTADYLTNNDQWIVSNRIWEVIGAPALSDNVKVRYYYNQQDIDDMVAAAELIGPVDLNDPANLIPYHITQDHPLSNQVIANGGTFDSYDFGTVSQGSEFIMGDFDGTQYVEFEVSELGGGNLGVFVQVPLPVSWAGFSGKKIGKKVLLEWRTSEEENNDHFIVERSVDGQQFTPIAYQAGNGTAATLNTYEAWDETPLKRVNYYRIKQVDFDGGYSYSDVVTVAFETDKDQVYLFPNPSNGKVYVELADEVKGWVNLELIDVNGRIVWQERMDDNQQAVLQKNFSEFPAGIYSIRVFSKGHISTHQLLLKKVD